MLRVVGVHLLLFLLPFFIYGLYLYFSRIDPLDRQSWDRTPLYWLTVGGLVLTIAGFFLFAAFTGAGTDGTYVPARYEDGRLIPGRIE